MFGREVFMILVFVIIGSIVLSFLEIATLSACASTVTKKERIELEIVEQVCGRERERETEREDTGGERRERDTKTG